VSISKKPGIFCYPISAMFGMRSGGMNEMDERTKSDTKTMAQKKTSTPARHEEPSKGSELDVLGS
jgi:hypothetical protein